MTHEEFVEKLNNIDANIEVLTQYNGCKEKMRFRCKICGCEWTNVASNVARTTKHSGCPDCSKKEFVEKITFSNEKFVEKLKKVNPTIIALEPYIKSNKNMQFQCNICEYKWKTYPTHVTNPSSKTGKPTGCPNCSAKARNQEHRITNEVYLQRLQKINPTIIALGTYETARTPMKFKCTICGHIWFTKPCELTDKKNPSMCPKCAKASFIKKKTLSQEQFLTKWNQIGADIELLEKYNGADKPIRMRCKICGFEWLNKPSYIIYQKHGCPKCAGKRHNTEWLKAEISKYNPDITPLGEYAGMHNKVEMFCNICGNKWFAKPNHLVRDKTGCPRCKGSHGEKRIANILNQMNIDFESEKVFEDCTYKNVLRFDFYIPAKNLCIEYDGRQHFQPVNFGSRNEEESIKEFDKTQQRDAIKTKYCIDHNISLLRIPYWEFDNIESFIKIALLKDKVNKRQKNIGGE